MRVLVTGAAGQVGRAVRRALPDAVGLDRAGLELTDAAAVRAAVRDLRPDVVVNAAAWTAVDAAEAHEDEARAVNADGPAHLAEACAAVGAALLHLSTDYVFDGARGPWTEDDPTGPLGAYGRTKLAGEEAVRARLPRHGILRTSWVYGPDRPNFVSAIVGQARRGGPLRVVDDQRGGPTPTDGLARAIAAWIARLDEAPWGTWHVCGLPHTTWHGFACAIVDRLGAPVEVLPVPSSAFPRPAPRPRDSRLDPSRFAARFGVSLDWRDGLADVVEAWR